MTAFTIRRAKSQDLEAILQILCKAGLPGNEVKERLDDFWVAQKSDHIVGCVGIEFYDIVCLPRSLAVLPEVRKQNIGKQLWIKILQYARQKGMKEAIILTQTAAPFFMHNFGFSEICRSQAPAAVRQSFQFSGSCCADAVCMRLIL